MKKIKIQSAIVFCFAMAAIAVTSTAIAQNYKCKGSDGKIEYSDRPCDTSKESLNQQRSPGGIVSTPAVAPMLKLENLFADFEPRLCEREKLATEVDMAQRSGVLKSSEAVWKPKQERLNLLNDSLIEFQEKAGKITKGTGSDSKEMMAVRKFQRKLKECGDVKNIKK
ncbi:MAG: DUF4124 domain-containing protein [Betaproteobacteria bacterium]